MESFQFDSQRWRDITVRQRALYKATIALAMTSSPRDFHSGIVLNRQVIEGESVDDHHVFPRKYLEESGHADVADTVLNHTLIDKYTNIRIGKKAPSRYLAEISKEMDGKALGTILESHRLPPDPDGPLWRDDYLGFLEWRQAKLAEVLAEAVQ